MGATALLVGASLPLAAQESDHAAAYLDNQRMISAASACKYTSLDIRGDLADATAADKAAADHAQERIAERLETEMASHLTAAEKLFLIEQARDEVRDLIHVRGCKDEQVAALVDGFEAKFGAGGGE
jgi:hypothetical protein